jgi:hypothetical protein
MTHLGRKKIARKFQHMGKKSIRAVKHAGQKVDMVKSGHLMQDVGSAGEMAAGLLAFAAPEVAAPLLAGSEALKYGGRAVSGAGKAKKQASDGNYVSAAMTIEKTVVSAKNAKSKLDKKYR